jgi:D-alanyl-D-alanine carboxypeptidase/D-alanyl-D-alanine carboxypeptidase (penicillin-binding protein 5/6)
VYASSAARREVTGISAKAAVLYEPETGSFLYKKNADTPLPMASTTKIMTALVALDNASLTETVKIHDLAVGVEGSSAYLKRGDEVTMEELLYALLLRSANDAAAAIAFHIGGSIEGFAILMNEKAEELGLESTNFQNPHGLDGKEHYTTAKELAIIASHALDNAVFKEIVSTYKKTFNYGDRQSTYINHNKLLNLYDGCIGVKTGFTKKSGRCLVGAAEKDGLTFITVTLDAPNDWSDHEKLFDIGYSTLEKISFAKAREYRYSLPVIDGVSETVTVSNREELSKILERGEYKIDEHIKLSKFVTAPIKEGDVLGEVCYTLDGEYVGSVRLVAERSVASVGKRGFFERITDIFKAMR